MNSKTGDLALNFENIESFLLGLVLVLESLHFHGVVLRKAANSVFNDFSDSDHLCHSVSH